MSATEPEPGTAEFLNVNSTTVQSSPSSPQAPVCKYARAEMIGPFETKSPPVDKESPFSRRVGAPNPQSFVKWTVCDSALTAMEAARATAA